MQNQKPQPMEAKDIQQMLGSLPPGPKCIMPGEQVPSFNVGQAFARGVQNKFLMVTWGGLGDQVCAEPTLRYAFKAFKSVEFFLGSEAPELFSHLHSGFKEIFDLKKVNPIYENYLTFRTIEPPTHLLWQFASHCLVNCVDFPSICAFRCQLPVEDRNVVLVGVKPETDWADGLEEHPQNYVVIHAGKHWPSKTFPKQWWDSVIKAIVASGRTPILIGKRTDDNRDTVDVTTEGCIDIRNQTNLKQLIWACMNANVVLTNDSSPLHISAPGRAHIGYIASCKHPDYITHWRKNKAGVNEWGWRMKNLGHDGCWNHIDSSPAKDEEVSVEFLPKSLTWDMILPSTDEVMEFINAANSEI